MATAVGVRVSSPAPNPLFFGTRDFLYFYGGQFPPFSAANSCISHKFPMIFYWNPLQFGHLFRNFSNPCHFLEKSFYLWITSPAAATFRQNSILFMDIPCISKSHNEYIHRLTEELSTSSTRLSTRKRIT